MKIELWALAIRHLRTMGKFSAAFLLFALAASIACESKPTSDSPNLVLIIIDTLRADHLGCYGYERNTSPNIDRFSRTGVLFENVYCQTPITGPSHASIFTSRYPMEHGVLKNGWALPESYRTVAEILKKEGYTTGAIVSSFAVSSRFGFSRGFRHYDEEFLLKDSTMGHDMEWEYHYVKGGFDQRADVTTQKAVNWIRGNAGRKLFLWVHYFDPHAPYKPPAGYDKGFAKKGMIDDKKVHALYDSEIRYVDDHIGILLDELKAREMTSNTMIIIMSDHGEGLKQHGWMEHGMYLYDEEVKIPLIISFPGVIPQNQRFASIVQSIDVAPTILDFLGLEPEKNFVGKSLRAIMQNADDSSHNMAFLERRAYKTRDYQSGPFAQEDLFGVRHGNTKYIWAPQKGSKELYDLAEDAGEVSNVVDARSKTAEKMQDMILSWKASINARRVAPEQTLDEDTREKLKALGYVE